DLSALFVRRGTASGSWPQCTISDSSRLSMNLVAQPSRLRVATASGRQHELRAGHPLHSQARTPARTPALHPTGNSWSQCMRKNERGLSMNPQCAAGILPAARWRHSLTCSRFMVPFHQSMLGYAGTTWLTPRGVFPKVIDRRLRFVQSVDAVGIVHRFVVSADLAIGT